MKNLILLDSISYFYKYYLKRVNGSIHCAFFRDWQLVVGDIFESVPNDQVSRQMKKLFNSKKAWFFQIKFKNISMCSLQSPDKGEKNNKKKKQVSIFITFSSSKTVPCKK